MAGASTYALRWSSDVSFQPRRTHESPSHVSKNTRSRIHIIRRGNPRSGRRRIRKHVGSTRARNFTRRLRTRKNCGTKRLWRLVRVARRAEARYQRELDDVIPSELDRHPTPTVFRFSYVSTS